LSGFIPEEKIAEIMNTADIVDIISDSVLLKKAGTSFKGLCPFHSEKTPSFTVNPEKKMFYCFGCGTGGNVISFLMKQNAMTFPETARMLAGRYGIEIQTANMTPEQKKLINERESLLELNHDVMEFFRYNLLKSDNGRVARRYLEKRGISDEVVKRFCLGFIPDGWENLVNFIKKKKLKRGVVEKSGLVIKKDNGGYYDRFRNRIIFPIFDIGMKVTGFGGRVMDDSLPKYLNSPETQIYAKSRSLYGLHLAKNRCRQTDVVFIVEGYFDLIALCQHGIENVVASLGTALTVEHIRMLKGYASKMILVYDSDTAGIKAAIRSIPIFANENVDARILVLPEGHDPDSFVFEFGMDLFLDKADKALSAVSFLIQIAIDKHGLSMDGKVRIIADMLEPVAAVADGVARSIYIKELAERIGVDEVAILNKIRETISLPSSSNSVWQASAVANTNVNVPVKIDRMEKQIVSMMLQFPDIIPEIRQHKVLDFFKDELLKSIGNKLLDINYTSNQSDQVGISFIMEQFENNAQRDIVALLAVGSFELISEKWNYHDCEKVISHFLSIQHKNDDSLNRKIKAAEENNDDVLLMQLLSKKQNQAKTVRAHLKS